MFFSLINTHEKLYNFIYHENWQPVIQGKSTKCCQQLILFYLAKATKPAGKCRSLSAIFVCCVGHPSCHLSGSVFFSGQIILETFCGNLFTNFSTFLSCITILIPISSCFNLCKQFIYSGDQFAYLEMAKDLGRLNISSPEFI